MMEEGGRGEKEGRDGEEMGRVRRREGREGVGEGGLCRWKRHAEIARGRIRKDLLIYFFG